MKYFKISLFLLSIIFLTACEEDSGTENPTPDQPWTYTGLGGISVTQVAVQDDMAYAGTREGMFRQPVGSSDTSSWSSAGLGGEEITDFVITAEDQLIASVALDSDNPTNTLFITNDGGNTWTPLASDFGGESGTVTCQALDYDPTNTSVLYGRGNYNIAKSTDGGTTWTSVFAEWGSIGYQADLIKVYDDNPDIVWAGGETSIFSPYMVKSMDAGESWQLVQVPSQGDNAVYSMVFAQNSPERILAGMEGQVIYTEDGGENWQIVLQPDNYSYFNDMKRSEQNPDNIYIAGTDGGNDLGDVIIYTSSDFGQSWNSAQHAGQPGKEYAARDLGLYTASGAEAMYVATNDGVFIYKP